MFDPDDLLEDGKNSFGSEGILGGGGRSPGRKTFIGAGVGFASGLAVTGLLLSRYEYDCRGNAQLSTQSGVRYHPKFGSGIALQVRR